MKIRRKLVAAGCLASLAAGGAAAPSALAETIGTVPDGVVVCPATFQDITATTIATSGTITQFRYRAANNSSAMGDLQVLRPTGNANEYAVVSRTTVQNPSFDTIVTVPVFLPVQAGDRLGIYSSDERFPCHSSADDGAEYVRIGGPRPGVSDKVTSYPSTEPHFVNLEATIVSNPPTQPPVESFSTQKSTAPVSESAGPLEPGQAYNVTVRGTYSPYDASLMMAGTPKYFAMCGFPEAQPLFMSPATENSRVGSDPEFLFAFPQSGKKCSAKIQAALPKRQSSVRFNTGDGAGYVTPTAAGAAPNSSHSYTYRVLGAGQALKIKIPGSNYRDNYGRYQVTIATARPVILPPA